MAARPDPRGSSYGSLTAPRRPPNTTARDSPHENPSRSPPSQSHSHRSRPLAPRLRTRFAKQPGSSPAPPRRSAPGAPIVSGRVDPRGESTSWYVEYGKTTAYGSRTDARSAGNGTSAVDVTEQLRGLETGVTYHYRVVASNGSGSTRGADATFTTQGLPEVATGVGIAARAVSGDRRRDGRSRTDARPAGGSSTARARATARAPTRGRPVRARARSPSPFASRSFRPGSSTTSGSSRRTTSAPCAAPTGRSAPIRRRRSRRAASTASASRRRASTGSSTRADAERSRGSSTARARSSGTGRRIRRSRAG